jgi:hypothetical protein
MTVRPETPQTDPGWVKNIRAAEDAEAQRGFDGHCRDGSRFGVGSRRLGVAKDMLLS